MRIAIATRGDLFPTNHGAAVKIVRTAEYLSLLGHEVFVVTDDRDAYHRFAAGRHELLRYPVRARAAQEWPLMRDAGRLAEHICRRMGYPGEETFLYRPQFDPAWWGRVLAVGHRHRVDVYQAEFPGYGVPCWLAAKLLGGRSSVVQHNVEYDRMQDVLGLSDTDVARVRAAELWVLRHVDDVIAVSADDRDRMVRAGVPGERVTVIPHGVDTWAYRAPRGDEVRFSYGLPAQAPLLFFHGTLHYWPNTLAVRFLAEELLPRLLPRHPDLRVLVAGLNPPAYYRHPALHFTGPVVDLPGHIAAADLTVCPVPSGGGTRMKILEYFAAGKACVSFSKGAEGIRARDGVEIALRDDADGFAAACLELLAAPERRRAMGSAARAFVAHYDWTEIAKCYVALYEGRGRATDYNGVALSRIEAGVGAPTALAPPAPEGRGVEAHLPVREPSKPLTLLLLINRGCNLRCSFCDLWDDPDQMSVEQAVGLLDDAAAIGTRTLVITGGEPLIHKGVFDVVRAARERGMGVNITTNGTLVEKRWEEVVASGVSSLSVSIDGLEATHDEVRGQKGAWRRTVRALRRLKEETDFALSVYFTVNSRNVHELVPVYDLVRELDIGFDFWPVNDATDLYLRTPEQMRLYREGVEYISRSHDEVAMRRHFYELGLEYHAGNADPVRCLGLVDQYGVTYAGDLLPCCVWGGDGLKVGNVFEKPLLELWRSPEVQAFRLGMYHDGCTAGCFNHSLYEFTRSTGESFRVGTQVARRASA